jgi:SAM-dependent methyltransferase
VNRVEATIDRLANSFVQPSLLAWRALERTAYEVPAGGVVLDLGAGLGDFTADVAPQAIAVDLDLRQLRRGRARGTLGRAVQADLRHLPFRSGVATAVIANCVFEHIPGLDEALDEVHRVLDPDGNLQTTVPLTALDDAYLVPRPWYRALRNRQLAHRNVHTLDGWARRFRRRGLTVERAALVVFHGQARRWDLLDIPLFAGIGGYTWFNLYTRLLARFPRLRRLHDPLSRRLARWIAAGYRPGEPAVCAHLRARPAGRPPRP